MNKDNTSKREYLRRLNSDQSLYTLLQYVFHPFWELCRVVGKLWKR
jgi:hypothetical protein